MTEPPSGARLGAAVNGSTYTYFGSADDRRLQQIYHQGPGAAPLNLFTYTYDDTGNITSWGQMIGTNRLKRYHLEYDRTDELEAATQKNHDGTLILKRYRYAYDAAGNRTAEQIENVVSGASYDTMNRLLSQQPGGAQLFRGTTSEAAFVTVQAKPANTTPANEFSGTAQVTGGQTDVVVQATDYSLNTDTNTYRVTQSGASRSFTYDANGNLQTKSEGGVTTTYEWDAENHLLAVKQGSTTLASFTYDGKGRRSSKTNAVAMAVYIWDGQDVLEELSSLFANRRYIQRPGIDQHLAVVENGTASYFVADHLSSVVRMTNSGGSPTLTREYDPWGNLLQGGLASGYGYTGREWDAEIGLHYFRARYYDSAVGRFINMDPIGFQGGINSYAYVENNPAVYSDPQGLTRCTMIGSSLVCVPDVPWCAAAGSCVPTPSPGPFFAPIGCLQAQWYAGGLAALVLGGQFPGRDKVAHCLAHCEIRKQCGPTFGTWESNYVSYVKEGFDAVVGSATSAAGGGNTMAGRQKWDWDDIGANNRGRTCSTGQSCFERCWNAQSNPHP